MKPGSPILLLARCGLIAASACAPAIAPLIGATAGKTAVLAGLLSGGLGLAAGIGLDLSKSANQKRLVDNRKLLRNRDLARLAQLATERSLTQAASEFETYGPRLRKLAKVAEAAFADALAADATFGEDAVRDIAAGRPGRRKQWQHVLAWLAQRADVRETFGTRQAKLLDRLEALFTEFVDKILIEDAGGRGPMEGRAWPALQRMFWTRLFHELEDRQAETIKQLWDAEDRQGRKLAAFEQTVHDHLTAQYAAADESASDRHDELWRKLDDLPDAVAQQMTLGLIPLDRRRTRYWHDARNHRMLTRVWSDQNRRHLLERTLVGRDQELAEFDGFLAGNKGVLYWRGPTGFGKTRLTIAAAERAVALGWTVWFVGGAVDNLVTALSCRTLRTSRVLLVWDDYRGEEPDKLRRFIEFDRGASPLEGIEVKRLINSWPNYSPHVLQGLETSHYHASDIQGVSPEEELTRWLLQLDTGLDREAATEITRKAEHNPQVALHALELRLGGQPVPHGREHILGERFQLGLNDLFRNAKASQQDDDLRRALTVFAAIGAAHPIADLTALQAAQLERGIDLLVEHHQLQKREDGSLRLYPDALRRHVLGRAFSDQPPLGTSVDAAGRVLDLLTPLAVEAKWMVEIWAMALAVLGPDAPEQVLNGLTRRLVETVRTSDGAHAERVASSLYAATIIEPSSATVCDLANQIAAIRDRHDSEEIALEHAKALMNATVGTDAVARLARAAEIAAIRDRHDTEEIALEHAKALTNATAAAGTDAASSQARAAEIAAIRDRHDTEEIALAHAKALMNATAAADADAATCRACAAEIAAIRDRHDNEEIALAHANALMNATVAADAAPSQARAAEIAAIRDRHDNEEIALAHAKALRNATVAADADAAFCQAGATEIAAIRDRHDTEEIALEHAKALRNATVGTDAAPRQARAAEIAAIRDRHDSSEIALQHAMALCNATIPTDATKELTAPFEDAVATACADPGIREQIKAWRSPPVPAAWYAIVRRILDRHLEGGEDAGESQA